MAEIKLSFDLTFSRRFLTAAGAAAMMLCAVPELDSESVTLSTYYPAPSGVYTNMITTANTYLARDGGNVGVGTTAPVGKLDVKGPTARTGTHYATPTFYVTGTLGSGQTGGAAGTANVEFRHDNGTQGIGFGYNTIYQTGSNANQDLNFLSKGSSHITLNAYAYSTGNVGIGTTSPGTKLSVSGDINSTGALQTRQGTSCIDGTLVYGPGGGTTNNICPAGRYVTLIDGVYAKKSIMYAYSAGGSNQVSYDIDFRCCPCPAGGCSGM